jgi:hypothetical protein
MVSALQGEIKRPGGLGNRRPNRAWYDSSFRFRVNPQFFPRPLKNRRTCSENAKELHEKSRNYRLWLLDNSQCGCFLRPADAFTVNVASLFNPVAESGTPMLLSNRLCEGSNFREVSGEGIHK